MDYKKLVRATEAADFATKSSLLTAGLGTMPTAMSLRSSRLFAAQFFKNFDKRNFKENGNSYRLDRSFRWSLKQR